MSRYFRIVYPLEKCNQASGGQIQDEISKIRSENFKVGAQPASVRYEKVHEALNLL